MRLQRFILGELAVNSYLLWDEDSKEGICVDPGGPVKEILAKLADEKIKLTGIVLTHGHADHILGVNELRSQTSAPVSVHAGDAGMLSNPMMNLSHLLGRETVVKADQILADGSVICLGSNMVNVLHTPGHTPGGICLIGPGLMITGDTLFAGSIGRTDLPGGDQDTLLRSAGKLLKFSDQVRVFPGHGPETSIGQERDSNPFLRTYSGR